jgi:hypothetical protein
MFVEDDAVKSELAAQVAQAVENGTELPGPVLVVDYES